MKTIVFLLFLCWSVVNIFAQDQLIYVTGSMNSWADADDGWKLTPTGENNMYRLEKTLAAGDYEYQLINGTWGDGSIVSEGTHKISLSEEKTVTFWALSPTNFYCSEDIFYVIGTAMGTDLDWNLSTAKKMTKKGTIVYWTGEVTEGGLFKIIKIHDEVGYWGDITPENIRCDIGGTVTVKLDLSTLSVSVSEGSLDGVDKINDGFQINVGKGYVLINANDKTEISIHSIEGKLIDHKLFTGSNFFPLEKGIYIIRMNGKTKKIVVP